MQNVLLNVKGMSCGHCVNSVEGALKEIGAQGKVDLKKGTVAVEFDDSKLSLDNIKEAIEDQGYDVD
ncbi:copper chaperone CopZ [Paenibacillus sp. D2_2]|uniref:copper chaperone CopZ n=1 Tax=Paenibacillus sp. D2_2 TaxID=3073092 RepID=UPI0028163E48|nr:copper chaperone CopZ [Paenibacillus sp. D2_2]WMT41338.1 copper chaperone CopZ [Paenibacillus sp. D2_2]